jgi:hypothetical protein
MKKYILPALMLATILVPLSFGLAADPPFTMPAQTTFDIWAQLRNALNWFFNALIFIAAIMIVYSGWQYVTAAGDAGKTGKALNTLIYALIGVAIALLAKGLIYFVMTYFGGKGTF